MANFFDQFDEAPKTGNFFDQFDEKPTQKERKSTIGSELVRGGKQIASSVRTSAGSLFGSPEEAALAGVARSQAIGEEAGEGASLEAVKRAYQEKGLLSAAGEVASQIPRALAGQVPQLALLAGGAKAGAVAGAPLGPVGSGIGAAVGAGATLLPQFFGSMQERQAAEQLARGEQVKIDQTKAALAATGASALEGAGTAFVLGKRVVKGVLGITDDAALATANAQKNMVEAARRSLAASAGRGATRGALVEMPIEIATSVIERAQAGLNVTSPDAIKEYGEVAYQSALVGGSLGTIGGVANRSMARQGVAAKEELDRAESERIAEEERARAVAQEEEKAKTPPLALGAEGVFTPVSLPDGSVAMTREDLAQYEAEQFRKKYEPQKVEVTPAPEPYVPAEPITGTGAASLMAEPRDVLAGVVSGRREAEEAKAEIPLGDNYAFLQREKQRLLQQDQTPETKTLLERIDARIGEILTRDIERQRADAQAAKTSVFGQAELPPVESRNVVVGGEELAKLQARELPAERPVKKSDIAAYERMQGQPAPKTQVEMQAEEAEKAVKGIKSINLRERLQGKLTPEEVSEIAPRGKGFENLSSGKKAGTSITTLIENGELNEFLPPNERPGMSGFDPEKSAEDIRQKLRDKDNLTFDATIERRMVEEGGREARENLEELQNARKAQVEISEALADQDIRYQRSTAGGKSIGKDQTQSIADAVKSRWANAPEVVIAENMDDAAIPQAVRDHNKAAVAAGAKGSPKGFFYKGKAYILADSMTSANDVMETLFHESLGHYGLRGTFGPEMGKVLADVVKNRKADVEAKAQQYGLDVNSESDMLEAAEEVLAEMAQTKPGLSFVKRAISVIRNFLRDLGLPFKMTNDDIIQKYILPARAFVERGEGRAVEGAPAAMREPAKAPATDSAAFKKWFGDSKVVDENGEPLVVYHGTIADFDAFSEGAPRNVGFTKDSKGFYFSADSDVASGYATYPMLTRGKEGGNVMPVYLSIKNPLRLPFGSSQHTIITPKELADYEAQGYDGIIVGEFDEVVAFRPEQIKSATGNVGTYDPENADIRYQREAGQPNPTRQNIFGEPVLGTWSITVDPKMELQDGIIYKLLDKNIDVKRIVEAVKSTGKQIASQWNPYLQEELYHGRTANASQEFQDKEWLPLLQDMDKKGVTIGELEKYLLNRHAEDYNRVIAERNPDRPEMQDGGSSVKTEDARKYLADLSPDLKKKYEELAKRVDGITKGTRQLLVDTGYEKAETVKAWEKAFPNYVPLMREESDFDYNFGSFGTGRGFDVRRDFSRSAMGSKRNVVDIIGNVISARNQAISLTEKNRVAQAVYGLALEAPNPDFWMAINPDLAEVREVERIKQKIAKFMAKKSDPNITDDELDGVKSSLESEYKKLKFAQTKATEAIERVRKELIDLGIPEETISAVMQEPEQRILDEKKGRVVKRVNTKLRENDHVLATRINGERRYVFFNPKDPRSKRAATALKNLDAQDLGTALGLVAKVTRWMASVNTQYNPIFGPYNFLRDIQSAALQLSTTELAGQQKEIAANIVPSLRVIYSSLRKRRKGEKVEGELADLWKEFQREGGQTGFKDNFSRTQDRTEALINEMEKITEGKVKANARAVFDWLSDYNDSLENAVRLSAYKVAKEKFAGEGFSDSEAKQKAASLAKNLTVNFNRKGDVATQMGALYAFFNASMQGTARMIETLKGPAGKKIMAGGLLLGSMQAALLAAAGFDDEEPPEFIRSKNIVIPTGDGDYVAFPMPLGFHVIPGLSRILTEWTLSGFKDTARRVTDLTGLFLDAFNPIGNAGWSVQTITPTVLDPLVALGENKDWTGKPIFKEDIFSLRPTPGYTRAREGANALSTGIAKFLNMASGGDEDRKGILSPTPEQIDYLVGQAFGGVGREAIKLATTVEKTITGEELPPYKIPLYGRFVGETKSAVAESNKFYKNMMKLNELQAVVDGRRDRKEPLGDFFKENPEARLLPMANKTYKDVQALRKRRAALVERNAPRESVQAVEKQITRKMQVLNDRVRALEESN